MRTLNLGILAHVDAGKTSLTERLLHTAGVIDEIGSVDDGSTQTDSLALERQRGITIRSAVVSFAIDDVTVNLIDTPGHPDFIAEVERVLDVLDGAVLVISAVEGVQAQTRILMRTLQRLRIPTLIFVNKVDRGGARDDELLRSIAERLSPAIVAMGSVADLGTRGAAAVPFSGADPAFASGLVDLLGDHDDAFVQTFVDSAASVSYSRLRAELSAQTARAVVHPVYFGSAITGAGVDSLVAGIRELLPAPEGDADGPPAGRVFKVERVAGEKVAYVRMFSGTVRTRERLYFGRPAEGRVTAISVFENGSAVRGPSLSAGRIGKLWGLGEVRIGDRLGAAGASSPHHFAPPTLETVVLAADSAQRGALHVALTQLAEQDPLINVRLDHLREEISVSLYGEVQKEVIQATLANEFGIGVTYRETTTICIERPVGVGRGLEVIAQAPNPFLATVGLRIEPAAPDSGVSFALGVELGSMPLSFFKAVEETVHETLQQGIHGWRVTDCLVTMTHSGYWARQSTAHGGFDKSMSSTAGDFRNLTRLVLMDALVEAGVTVSEPMHHFRLEYPADTSGSVLPTLARLRAAPEAPTMLGTLCVLEGEVPAARVHELGRLLPGLTRGEGVLESTFSRYEPVRGPIPARDRSDHNPLDRKEYLLHVLRRV